MQRFKMLAILCLGMWLLGAESSLSQAQEKAEQQQARFARIEKIYSQLDLTPEQKSQLEANKDKNRLAMKDIREQMKSRRQALRDELMKPQLDMDKINTLHQQSKSLQAQLQDNKLTSILAVRSILTPQQFSTFLELMQQSKQQAEKK